MVATNQKAALARVLGHEGGNADDPHDPGGRTSRGVTQRVYDAWRRGHGQPARDVFLASTAEVRAIYLEQYWHRVRADELPAGLDYAVFDAAVNSGPVQAVKWLQRDLGVRVDGVVGQVTLTAARSRQDVAALIASQCARRLAFLKQLRMWRRFGAGWTKRVANVERVAIAMAGGARLTESKSRESPLVVSARADPGQISRPSGAGFAGAAAGAGLATAAAAEALADSLRQAAADIGLAAQSFPAVAAMASAMTACGLLLLVAGVCWRLYIAWRWRVIDKALCGPTDTGNDRMAACGPGLGLFRRRGVFLSKFGERQPRV